MKHVVLTLLVLLFASPALALELELPVACTLGTDCWVQQYPDHDTGPGATDFTCGIASYDGHDGTDFRSVSTVANINVIAAAAGTVKGMRDGVVERFIKTKADIAALGNQGCGNGVVIDHGDGWETQYCHMRRGSVAVKVGDRVETGSKLGQIGYSGATEFPHVHLSVRKNGQKIDPFSADTMTDCKAPDRTLWSADAQKMLAYKGTDTYVMQWADRVYTPEEINSGALPTAEPNADWPALVAHVAVMVLQEGDEVTLAYYMPEEAPVVNRVVMKRHRALQLLHAGKSKRQGGWPPGVYESHFEVRRKNTVVLSRSIRFEFK